MALFRNTHADNIRSMTDEELAQLLTNIAKKSAEKLCENLKTVEVNLSGCNWNALFNANLDWLKDKA